MHPWPRQPRLAKPNSRLDGDAGKLAGRAADAERLRPRSVDLPRVRQDDARQLHVLGPQAEPHPRS